MLSPLRLLLLLFCCSHTLSAAPTISAKSEFFSGEPIVIEFAGLPGNQKDWIVISHPNNTPFRPGNIRQFTRGKQAGQLEFDPQAAGEYEARLYLNYPIGGYKIYAKSTFKVVRQSQAKTGGEISDKTDDNYTLPTIEGMESQNKVLSNIGGDAVPNIDGEAVTEAPPSPPMAITSQDQYLLNELVIVNFSGLDGHPEDYIAIPRPDAHKTYIPSNWAYSDGKKSGELRFKNLPIGNWEVRTYLDSTGWEIRSRHQFTIIEPDTKIKMSKTLYSTEEPIKVIYENLPGYNRDWISVISSGKGDHLYDKTGIYRIETKGLKAGEHEFPKLKSGEYEARVYFNYPSGAFAVKARTKFEVLDPDELEDEDEEASSDDDDETEKEDDAS